MRWPYQRQLPTLTSAAGPAQMPPLAQPYTCIRLHVRFLLPLRGGADVKPGHPPKWRDLRRMLLPGETWLILEGRMASNSNPEASCLRARTRSFQAEDVVNILGGNALHSDCTCCELNMRKGAAQFSRQGLGPLWPCHKGGRGRRAVMAKY